MNDELAKLKLEEMRLIVEHRKGELEFQRQCILKKKNEVAHEKGNLVFQALCITKIELEIKKLKYY